MKSAFLFIAITLSAVCSYAQVGTWYRSYGNADFNYGQGVVALPDTSFIILSNRTGPAGTGNIYLFRIDSLGEIMWERYFGENDATWGESIVSFNDSVVLITGYINSGGDYDLLLMAIDTAGNLQWEKSYNSGQWDLGNSATPLRNGFFWALAQTYDSPDPGSDIWLLKFDGYGDTIFSKRINWDYDDVPTFIDTASNNKLIMVMQNTNAAEDTLVSRLVRMSESFDTIWTLPFASDTMKIYLNCVRQYIWGDYVVAGGILGDALGEMRFYYAKIDSAGTSVAWEVIASGLAIENINRFVVDTNYTMYFTGQTQFTWFFYGEHDAAVWSNSLSGYKFNFFGEIRDDNAVDIDIVPGGGVIIVGSTASYGPGVYNIFVVRTDSLLQVNKLDTMHYLLTPSAASAFPFELYPNPASDYIYIASDNMQNQSFTTRIIDLSGRVVYENEGVFPARLDVSGLKDGLFVMRLYTNKGIAEKKLILYR